MALNVLTNPEIGGMTLRVTSGSQAVEFERFLEYEYDDDYLSPSDSWWFTLDQKELSRSDASVLVPGAKVDLVVDGHVQSHGVLDAPEGTFDVSGGNVVKLEGRDWYSAAVDAQVVPDTQFTPAMTLDDVVAKAHAQVGIPVVATDAVANRNVITGAIRGVPTTKKGRPLRKFVLGQEKPYHNEGVYAFCSRISQRFGLWLRPAVDGQTLIIGKPDFEQAPRYGICHALDARSVNNNVSRGHFKKTRRDQPSVIYARGAGGGGTSPASGLRAGIVNPVVLADNTKLFDMYPGVPFVTVPAVTAAFSPLVEEAPRAAFLKDSESHTQAQLNAYILRELSLRMRKALEARYEIMGHKLNGQPVAVDSIVNVLDQQPIANWAGPLWVLGRKFHKSVKGGTRTTIDLILPGSLLF